MRYLITLFMVLMLTVGYSQSAFSVMESRAQETDEFGTQQVSLANPWIGAKLSYAITDPSEDLVDNFIFSARVMYTVAKGDKFSVPLVSIISLGSEDLLSPESGYNMGVFPYYIMSTSPTFTLVAHGGVNYKLIPQGSDQSVQQIRMLAGMEASFGEVNKLPMTLSVTPVYYFNNVGADIAVDNTFGIEMTGIIPIGQGLGIMVEYQQPFTKGVTGAFRTGIIVNGAL